MNTNSANLPRLSVSEAVQELSDLYSSVINNGISPKEMPSVMLWGPPGVGKSQAVRQIGRSLEESTGKVCKITDVRLLLFNPIDLRGIPTANADKTLAVWLKPKIFDMDCGEGVINILFLDEISAAPQSVQAAAYQITLDRVIGEHKLPDNCIVIAAGNRVTDKSVAYKMPKALANRLCHVEISGNADSWRSWAVTKGINDKVVGFLSFRPDYLMGFESSGDDLAFTTPRSWEMVSSILNGSKKSVTELYPLIAGCIGCGTAIEFESFCKLYNELPSMEDIFYGRSPAVPKSTDVLYALVSAMTAYAREHKHELRLIANSIVYAGGIPVDFAAVLVKNYSAIDKNYKQVLMQIPEFTKWIQMKGKFLNGII